MYVYNQVYNRQIENEGFNNRLRWQLIADRNE